MPRACAAPTAGGFAEAESTNYVVDFLSSSEGLQLNRAFVKIKDPKVRRKIVEMVKALGRRRRLTWRQTQGSGPVRGAGPS